MLDKELDSILLNAEKEILEIKTQHELNNSRSHFIGKKSQLNETKEKIEQFLNIADERIKELNYLSALKTTNFDYTMPGTPSRVGALHPLTIVQQKMEDILMQMGYQIAEGFDIDDEFHNFDALNTPKDHTARNLADTFYINNDILLRTQTSTVQVRTMEKYKPPIEIISPGRCYRNDKFDATHSPVFHQIEGLVVDEGISFIDLRDTINKFVKNMFGEKIKSRFRPHFFPFTEPSAEVDITCFNCGGKGCSTCKNSGWIEIAGCGMVDPNVFDILNIDKEKYTGFAFGFGVDRITMLHYHIPDIRFLYDNLVYIK
jgi:phenylalanyl-tRNA synthetase alpha chain